MENKQLTIVRYPDPILSQKSLECTEDDLPFIKEILPVMIKLTTSVNGVGLAAVQVGILKRFCIIKDASDKYNLLINPEIVSGHNLTSKEEGCLSLPLFLENIERFEEVTVKFRDENWVEHTAEMSGVEAQCAQHEINHANGLLLIDTVSLMKQQMYKKKLKKRGIL